MSDNLSRPLAGRCALITGSTAGIGLDTAEALGALGADLVINGFGEPQAIAGLCESWSERHAIRVIHHGADCTRAEQVRSLVGAAQDHGGGRLDILVNNAGFSVDSTCTFAGLMNPSRRISRSRSLVRAVEDPLSLRDITAIQLRRSPSAVLCALLSVIYGSGASMQITVPA